jgi:Mg-chelatase subunit ChlD
LTLDAGEKTTEIVTVNIENQALLEADIVFIVDESGSMGDNMLG